RVGRVKVIFKLPTIIEQPGVRLAVPDSWPTKHLAYVEWYTRQGTSPNKTNGMYQISNAVDSNGRRSGAIVPLANIRQVCMLTPNFGEGTVSRLWTSDTILDKCHTFWINNWSSKYAYQTLY
ncbi:hypothetical protein BKA70DRAFT_1131091, partial [Coprinopsis sp. MPI-PUGE-AT-0042]